MSKKRQSIVETAESLFYKQGFHTIGIKKVVAESGVSLMTLYNHFDSKAALILEVLDQREQRYFSFLSKFIKENDKLNHPASILAEAHMCWLEQHLANGCLFLRAKEEYTYENKEILEKVSKHKFNVIDFVKSCGLSEQQSYRLVLQLEGATALSEYLDTDIVRQELLSSIHQLFPMES